LLSQTRVGLAVGFLVGPAITVGRLVQFALVW
jgi:hypothetical protein